jgi:HK97 gp10 family phage protein
MSYVKIKLKNVVYKADAAGRDKIAKVLQRAAEIARILVPVRTGYLRSKIEATRTLLKAEAHYASYVERGTEKMAAQPFIEPAIYQAIYEEG